MYGSSFTGSDAFYSSSSYKMIMKGIILFTVTERNRTDSETSSTLMPLLALISCWITLDKPIILVKELISFQQDFFLLKILSLQFAAGSSEYTSTC